MKKLVNESLDDFIKFHGSSLNEGILQKIGNFFGNLLVKVGNLLLFKDETTEEIEPVITPMNIGLLQKRGLLPASVSYIPSNEDKKIMPELSSLKSDLDMIRRPQQEWERYINGESMNESLNEEVVPLEHEDKNIVNISRDELFDEIEMAMDDPNKKPLMIWGAPGIGKTQIVKTVLSANGGGRLIDIQTSKMAPDDWTLPAILPGSNGELPQAIDLPKSWLPVYTPTGDPEKDKELDEMANWGNGGIIFLDELSRASESVQGTCLKLVDERIIGDSKLGSKWTIISASNRAVDDPETLPQWSTALGNRFEQVNYVPDFKSWKEWATGKVDQRIIDFLEFNQEFFFKFDNESTIYASPRSWDGASNAIIKAERLAKKRGKKRASYNELVRALKKNVGVDVAIAMGTFLRLLETVRKEDIRKILEDPMNAPLPTKQGSGYDQSEANALLSVVVSSTRNQELVDPEQFDNFVTYLIRLDMASIAVAGIQRMYQVHPKMTEMSGKEGETVIPDENGKPIAQIYGPSIDRFIEKYGDVLT